MGRKRKILEIEFEENGDERGWKGGIVYKVQNIDPIAAGIDNVNLNSLNVNHHHHHSCRIHLLYGPRLFFMSAKMSKAWNQAILTLLRVHRQYVRFPTFCCEALVYHVVLQSWTGTAVAELRRFQAKPECMSSQPISKP